MTVYQMQLGLVGMAHVSMTRVMQQLTWLFAMLPFWQCHVNAAVDGASLNQGQGLVPKVWQQILMLREADLYTCKNVCGM